MLEILLGRFCGIVTPPGSFAAATDLKDEIVEYAGDSV